MPDISIVIVNYRTAQLVIQCLESLSYEYYEEFRYSVIVTDNNSGDASVAVIASEIDRRGWNSWVSVFPLERNGGFAYGNNRAIEKILSGSDTSEFIWLLNPDTVVHKDACRSLVKFLRNNPSVGIVGSHLEEPDGTPQNSAFRDHSIASELLSGLRLGILDELFSRWVVASPIVSTVHHQADWVSGASMMIRREVFQDIGLLDEEFFMYFEEVDFIIRARKKGWSCWYVPESRVVHLAGAASGISSAKKELARRPVYWFDSRRRFFLKNHGWLTLFIADSVWMLGYSVWKFRKILQHKEDVDPPFFLRDFILNSFIFKGFRL